MSTANQPFHSNARLIDDVARRAGVSVETVVRVLANKPGVRAEVRGRATQVVQGLGYRLLEIDFDPGAPTKDFIARLSSPVLLDEVAENPDALLRLDTFYTALYAYTMLHDPDPAYQSIVGTDDESSIRAALQASLDDLPQAYQHILRGEQAYVESLLAQEKFVEAQQYVGETASQIEELIGAITRTPDFIAQTLEQSYKPR